MKIPYRNLSVRNPELKSELLQSVEKVLSHGRFILGSEVDEFEKRVAQYCGKKYAVGVNSGTDALYLALRGLDIGPGDEVITTPLSWIATLNSITMCGATPVFVDIKEDININEDLIEDVITPKTKAIIPVHFTGKLCNIESIRNIADKHGLSLVEDSAQAFGASVNGRKAGSFGHVSCFSMNPMKVFNSYGEAGAIVTDNKGLSEKIKSLRYNGTVNKEDCHYPSLNGRLDTMQAAMMLVNLKFLDDKIEKRRKIAHIYNEALKDIVICPRDDGCYHIYYSYTIITEKRNELKDFLYSKGIETKIQHPILMPYHSAYKHLQGFHIPVAERLVNQILCIPNQEDLTTKEIEYIIKCINDFFLT